tara:strand:- start:250 stop:585 length:336 start_codon:yes stop_codon:yes gene_type:complete
VENKLPTIPDKKYFSISEVSNLCNIKTHTLRFWEKEFNQLKPTTRRGNRRFYKKEDILLIWKIRNLLYVEGLTITGAKKSLSSENGKQQITSNQEIIQDLEQILKEIKEVV